MLTAVHYGSVSSGLFGLNVVNKVCDVFLFKGFQFKRNFGSNNVQKVHFKEIKF